MPPQSSPPSRGKGLCLLSLDAGGARAISQLKILATLMHRLNFDAGDDAKERPCTAFDMIGGIGTGGFIAILFTTFGLTVDDALEEFLRFNARILQLQDVDAPTRTTALKDYINNMLERHDIAGEWYLIDSNTRSRGCKLVVPISYKQSVGTTCTMRNFNARQDVPIGMTIAEALLATLATPPLFTPTSVYKESATFEYIGGDLALSNPTREVIAEAYDSFGSEERVACLLSIGCGHAGIIASPKSTDSVSWSRVLERIVADSERTAQGIDSQMGHLGLYYRLRVPQSIELASDNTVPRPGDVVSHTAIYLSDVTVSRNVDQCIEAVKQRNGIASLEQLKQSGGQGVLTSPLPPLTQTFVMRKEPWEFVEKAMLSTIDSGGTNAQRMLAVTGIGGCGKTQLILKFMRTYAGRFISLCVVDGSSKSRIQADITRHVRSMGIEHSQKSFDDCLLFLAQRTYNGPRLLLYDNVDDPDLDLMPLLPEGEECSIIITSRNRSIGELCPGAHLELDVMSMEEAVELLLWNPNRSSVVPDQTREDANAIAKTLGCLPIALQQARSYIYQAKCTTGAYLGRLNTSRDEILALPVKYQRDMRYTSTYAAFQASFEKLPLYSQKFIQLLSCFHWKDFPAEVISFAAEHGFADYKTTYVEHGHEFHAGKAVLEEIFLREGEWVPMDFDQMVISLQNYSLITVSPGVDTRLLQLHPLAHGWVKSSISEEDQQYFQSASFLLLAVGARDDYMPSAQYLASHVAHLSPFWNHLHVNNAGAFAVILHKAGTFHGELVLRQKVAADLQTLVAPHSAAFLDAMGSLAIVNRELGRYGEAEEIQVEILRLSKALLGDRHLQTITASRNLATTYYYSGKLGEAAALHEEVLALRKDILGDRHLDTIIATSNLASTYLDLGRYNEALALMQDVQRLRKELLGELHADTIEASNNLACAYSDLGRHNEALVLKEDILRLRKELQGEQHPYTITASSNLANTYWSLGRHDEAVRLRESVWRYRVETLGERHPDTMAASSNLAATYSDLGRLNEARVLQEEVLRLRKEILGDQNPVTTMASNNLAVTYSNLGMHNEALALQEEVLRLRRTVLGEHHPNTALAMLNLAITFAKLGQKTPSLNLITAAIAVISEALGTTHPEYIRAERLKSWVITLSDAPQALPTDQN